MAARNVLLEFTNADAVDESLRSCAGICELRKDPATSRYTRISVKLSEPLLKFRPRSDTLETLLHEAIHAYFFIMTDWRHSRNDNDDGTGHGLGFQLLADAISNHSGSKITIYHTFHDEVDSYRTHVWQCNGPCKDQPPYLGLVKRAMNRAPGKSDHWWASHELKCGGTFAKIQSPEPTKKQLDAMSKRVRAGRQKNKLDTWITSSGTGRSARKAAEDEAGDSSIREKSSSPVPSGSRKTNLVPVPGRDSLSSANDRSSAQKRLHIDGDEALRVEKKLIIQCPICSIRIADADINEHLDTAHPP